MTRGERVAWCALLALAILMPLAIGNLAVYGIPTGSITFDQFDLVKLTVTRVICIIGCVGLLWAYTREGLIPRSSWVVRLYYVFIALVVLSTIVSISPETAIFGKYRRYEGLLTHLLYGAAFLLAFQLVDGPERARTVALCLVGSGTVVAVYGAAQYVGLDPITWGSLGFESNRAFATYGNPNMLGSFILFPLLLAITLAYSEDDLRIKVALWVCTLVIMVAWFATFTRASWIAGVVGLVALAVIARRRGMAPQRVDVVFLGAIGIVLLVAIVFSMARGTGVMDFAHRIGSMFDLGSGSTSSRMQIWSAAWEATKDRPLFGWGADTFRQVFSIYKPFGYSETVNAISVADNAHNYPLHLMAGVGIPAMLAVYAFFLAPLVTSRWIVHNGSPVTVAFYVLVPVYLLNMMFGLSLVGTTTLLYVALGIVLAPSSRSGRTFEELVGARVSDPRLEVGIAVVGALVGSVLIVGAFTQTYADRLYLQARRAPLAERPARYERILELNPFNDQYRTQYGYALLQIHAETTSRPTDTDPERAARDETRAFRDAEDALLEAIERTPYEFDNVHFLVNLYNTRASRGDAAAGERALRLAEESVERWPYTAPMRIQYATALERAGRPDEAREQVAFSLSLDSDYDAAVSRATRLGMEVTPASDE